MPATGAGVGIQHRRLRPYEVTPGGERRGDRQEQLPVEVVVDDHQVPRPGWQGLDGEVDRTMTDVDPGGGSVFSRESESRR